MTVPFALAAGLSGLAAINGTHVIIVAGIAEIAAGSIAMSLGGYLAGQTELDHYNSELKREYEEVENLPEAEKQEVRDFFGTRRCCHAGAHLGSRNWPATRLSGNT